MATPKINAKSILRKLESNKKGRKKLSFYLSVSLYEDFKEACDKVPASQVIEELMRLFVESSKKD